MEHFEIGLAKIWWQIYSYLLPIFPRKGINLNEPFSESNDCCVPFSRLSIKGDLKCDLESVRKALAGFSEINFHPGWIPERFQEVEDRKFSFVHIDVDLADPTRDSLGFFYPRMQTGGIIVCDDYGMTTCPGATEIIDGFLEDKQEKMVVLPDGGGFLIRNAPTVESASLNPKARVAGRNSRLARIGCRIPRKR